MRKVKFTFNYGEEVWSQIDLDIWDGYAHWTTWNRFDNVSVDEKEYKRIEEYFRRVFHDDISDLKKGKDGLYSYAYGFTTSIINENDI